MTQIVPKKTIDSKIVDNFIDKIVDKCFVISSKQFEKSYHEAYIHFSGYNLDDFSRFESNLEFTLEYFEINPLGKITNDLLNKFSSCNSFDYNMQNDASGKILTNFRSTSGQLPVNLRSEFDNFRFGSAS